MEGKVRRYKLLQTHAREVVESRERKNEAPRQVYGSASGYLSASNKGRSRSDHTVHRLVRREIGKAVVEDEPGLCEVERVQNQRGCSCSDEVLEEAVPLEDRFLSVHLGQNSGPKHIVAENVEASAGVALVKPEDSLPVQSLHTLPVRLVDRCSIWLVQPYNIIRIS